MDRRAAKLVVANRKASELFDHCWARDECIGIFDHDYYVGDAEHERRA